MTGDKREIQFTDDHIEKIRAGRKITTMRTVKRDHVYPVGERVAVPGADLVLEILDMSLVRFGENTLEAIGIPEDYLYLHKNERSGSTLHLDIELERSLQRLAEFEGFESHEDMVAWFQGENPMGLEYNLPQPFFLYRFKPIRRSDSD